MQCSSCGAALPVDAPACPYCKAPSPIAAHRAEVEAAAAMLRQAEQEARAARDADQALADSAKKALFWSLGGVLCACAFVPSVVAIILGVRARGIAARTGRVAPTQATIAIVLGTLQVAGALALWTFVVIDERAHDRRRAQLTAQLDRTASAERLDQPTACALVELRLLEDGYRDASRTNITGFDCPGKVTQVGDKATLADVRFKPGRSGASIGVTACLKRGVRWTVADLRDAGRGCDEPAPSTSGAKPSP